MTAVVLSLVVLQFAAMAHSLPRHDDCFNGGCNAGDVNSLLQSKVTRSVIDHTVSQATSLATPLLQQIESMSLLAANERNATLLKVISKMLVGTLLPGLKNATEEAQVELVAAHATIGKCNSDAIADETTVDANFKSKKDASQTLHENCRDRQATKISDKKTKCDSLATFKASLVYPVPPLNSDSDETQLAHMDIANTFYTKNAPILRNLIEECNEATKALEAEEKQCTTDQGTFESHFCEYRAELLSLQKTSNSCYVTKKKAYEDLVVEKKALQDDNWKAEYLAMKKIECFLKVWLSDNNVKTVNKAVPPMCKKLDESLDYKDVTLDLSMAIPEEYEISTDPVTDYPGSEGFVDTYYTNQYVTYSPVQPCADADDAAAIGNWVKGANGKTCEQVCDAIGQTCDSLKQSTLTTNDLVRDAFATAGYTCKGFHGPRSYAGTPFSTGRNDDCAPMIPGSKSTCTANSHGHHAALCYCVGEATTTTTTVQPTTTTTVQPTADGSWVKGDNGKTCGQVCNAIGRTCDSLKQSTLTSNDLVRDAFATAGYTCKGFHGPRSYAGTPFSTGRNDDCAPMIPGSKSTCTANSHGHHAALCYCVPKAGAWVKGANGKTCGQVCNAIGQTCDSLKQSTLTSNALVRDAFATAGYTCKGFHGPRSYAGTPFSTGRNDDCAPMIPGSKSTCTANSHGHHAALCYCVG